MLGESGGLGERKERNWEGGRRTKEEVCGGWEGDGETVSFDKIEKGGGGGVRLG